MTPNEALAVAGPAVLVAIANSRNHDANAVAGNLVPTVHLNRLDSFLNQSANLGGILGVIRSFADRPLQRAENVTKIDRFT